MTNIHCIYDCIYQYDGCCCFDKVTPVTINNSNEYSYCIYFTKRENLPQYQQEQRFPIEEPTLQF